MNLRYKGAKNSPFFFTFFHIDRMMKSYKMTDYGLFMTFVINTLNHQPTTTNDVKIRLKLLSLLTNRKGLIIGLNHLLNRTLIESIGDELMQALSFANDDEKEEKEQDLKPITITQLLAIAITQLGLNKDEFFSLNPSEFFTAIEEKQKQQLQNLASNYYHNSLTAYAVIKGYDSKAKYDKLFKNPYTTPQQADSTPQETAEQKALRNKRFLEKSDEVFKKM